MAICETAMCGCLCVLCLRALYKAIFQKSPLLNDSQCMPEAGCREEEIEIMKDRG